jgi:hypothetical protein
VERRSTKHVVITLSSHTKRYPRRRKGEFTLGKPVKSVMVSAHEYLMNISLWCDQEAADT